MKYPFAVVIYRCLEAEDKITETKKRQVRAVVSEPDGGFFFSSVKLAIFLSSLKVSSLSCSHLCVSLLVFSFFLFFFWVYVYSVSPCLRSVMPGETNSARLDALFEEKRRPSDPSLILRRSRSLAVTHFLPSPSDGLRVRVSNAPKKWTKVAFTREIL